MFLSSIAILLIVSVIFFVLIRIPTAKQKKAREERARQSAPQRRQ